MADLFDERTVLMTFHANSGASAAPTLPQLDAWQLHIEQFWAPRIDVELAVEGITPDESSRSAVLMLVHLRQVGTPLVRVQRAVRFFKDALA